MRLIPIPSKGCPNRRNPVVSNILVFTFPNAIIINRLLDCLLRASREILYYVDCDDRCIADVFDLIKAAVV